MSEPTTVHATVRGQLSEAQILTEVAMRCEAVQNLVRAAQERADWSLKDIAGHAAHQLRWAADLLDGGQE